MQKYVSVTTVMNMIQSGNMSGVKDVNGFFEEYAKHKGSDRNRVANYAAPIGEDERNIIIDLFDNNLTLPEIEDKYGIHHGSLGSKAGRIALKMLYQNRSKIGI